MGRPRKQSTEYIRACEPALDMFHVFKDGNAEKEDAEGGRRRRLEDDGEGSDRVLVCGSRFALVLLGRTLA